MAYKFYFDETFHDRKIVIKENGTMPIFNETSNDMYIGVFIGFEDSKKSKCTKNFNQLMENGKKIYGMDNEFKSTSIKRKFFKYGIKSFDKNTMEWYINYFETLDLLSPLIHVNSFSKIELMLREIFDESELSRKGVISDYFYYSLTKFIKFYHSPSLIKAMYDSSEYKNSSIFRDELLKHLRIAIEIGKGVERKEKETPIFEEFIWILENYGKDIIVNRDYDFYYFQNFNGLYRFLDELKIKTNKVNLVIDYEEKTFQASKQFDFKNVKVADSKNVIELQIADHLCGFIGKMVYSLEHDENIKEDKIDNIDSLSSLDVERKRILSSKWFEFSENQYMLYKKIRKILVEKQYYYWSAMTGSYGDSIVMFYSLLNYLNSYKTYQNFKSVDSKMHAEYYNSYCCERLEESYTNMLNN